SVRAAIRRYYGADATDSFGVALGEFTDTEIARESPPGAMAGHVPRGRSGGRPAPPVQAARVPTVRARMGGARGVRRFNRGLLRRAGGKGVLYYVVEEGQRVLMQRTDGTMEVLVGPRRVLRWRKSFERMQQFVAHPGEFLIVRFRDGRQENLPGPTDVWRDPR